MQRPLMRDRIHRLNQQIPGRTRDRGQQGRITHPQSQHLPHQRPVPSQQMLNLRRRQPILVSQRRGVIRHSLIPLRPQQWCGIRHRLWYHPAPNILYRHRNRIPTNNPVGGVLPTSHRHQSGRHPRHRMVTGQIRGGLRRPTH